MKSIKEQMKDKIKEIEVESDELRRVSHLPQEHYDIDHFKNKMREIALRIKTKTERIVTLLDM